ncbi:sulfotransferase [Rhodohalobacter sp. 614A]|uniref:sulfotransferase n=1 Tax=Rhodohalobacter sp. 614A TaxID=2908649 RepID=UPI001F32C1E8|nr:sulfotransferase [Rhodohalobacter sp. 614A]
MLNKKVILICGYSRGGTNILWNILQSHPAICSPKYETGTIFKKNKHLKFNRYISIARRLGVLETSLSYSIIDLQLYRYKMDTLKMSDNKYKTETELYTRKEVSQSALCLKSVDYDIDEANFLRKIYPGIYIIFLIRNGYAVANGHMRRGMDIEKSATLYSEVGQKMRQIHQVHPRTIYVSFEEVLKNPFSVSEQLYKFTEVEPVKIQKLRFKSKMIINEKANEKPSFGEVNQKYWFDRNAITKMLDLQINQKQIGRLTSSQIDSYNRIAASQLELFGYDLLNPSHK